MPWNAKPGLKTKTDLKKGAGRKIKAYWVRSVGRAQNDLRRGALGRPEAGRFACGAFRHTTGDNAHQDNRQDQFGHAHASPFGHAQIAALKMSIMRTWDGSDYR